MKNKYLKRRAKDLAIKSDLYNKTAQEIGEYTHEDPAAVKQKHRMGPEKEENFAIFLDQPALKQAEVEQFYRKCRYYVYELPLWNAENNRPGYLAQVTLPYVRKNNYSKVMDFGGGAGDLCIELHSHGLEVTYCDISEKLFHLSDWRFKRRDIAITMIKGLQQVKNTYDCIFSFDAFEHIKDLPCVLKELIGHIRPGGSLIFSGAFSGGTLHLDENEKYNDFKQLDSLMRSQGLTFQDNFSQFMFYKK